MSDRTAYFTIVTKSYLAHGRALAARVRELDPEAKMLVFLADEPEGYFQPADEPFQCIPLGAYIPDEDRAKLTFGYNLFELCNALKAYAHQYMQENMVARTWCYFDSDILIVAIPEPFDAHDSLCDIVVTPHVTRLHPEPHFLSKERRFIHYGVLNGGFLALRRGTYSREFIAWFVARLREACFDRPPFLFVDQLWLNLLVGIDSVHIWRHPGANVAYWNIHERSISRNHQGRWVVNNEPLLFLHFSNWNSEKLDIVSSINPSQSAPREWTELAALYKAGLIDQGIEICQKWPYSFRRFKDGSEIKPYHRRAWLRLSPYEQAKFGDPFQAGRYFNKYLLLKKINYGLRHKIRELIDTVVGHTLN